MKTVNRNLCTLVLGVFALSLGLRATTLTIKVDCSGADRTASKTIAAALSLAPKFLPTTIAVSGTCNENVLIDSFDRLTIQGNPTATIIGNGDPSLFATVNIESSQYVTLRHLNVSAGGGVSCGRSSCILDHVTVQNSGSDGFDAFQGSDVQIIDSIIDSSAGTGVFGAASRIFIFGSTIQNSVNWAVRGIQGSNFQLAADASGPTSVQNNQDVGVQMEFGTSLVLSGARVTGNNGDGVNVIRESNARIRSSTITGNGGNGVRIGDNSFALFQPDDVLTGNYGALSVVCDPQNSTTRNLFLVSGITNPGTTNCAAELPTAP
jgi:hypothetical protein